MSVTLEATNSLYAYNGSLLSLLGLNVLPDISSPVSGTITDDDGQLVIGETGTTTVRIGSSTVEQPLNYLGSGYANSLLGLLGSTNIMIFSVGAPDSTQLYIYAPDGFPGLTGVAGSFSLGYDPFSMIETTPGVVDGTDASDTMNVGYTDADGDRITDYGGIFGPSGNDTIYGYSGDDIINSGSGNDIIYGGDDDDAINGGAGDDTIYGGDGDDTLEGGVGDDLVFGGAGNDTWLASGEDSATDSVYLGAGDDTAEVGFFTTGEVEILDGGDGEDTVALDAAVVDSYNLGITLNDVGPATNINFDTEITNFENVRGNSGSNAITGNNSANKLWGLGGSDTIDGGGGNDLIDGGDGDDTMTGGTGDDVFVWSGENRGNDIITDFGNDSGGPYNDTITTNNDFVDLSGIFNETTLDAYNSANGTDFVNAIAALNHDVADGVVNFNGTDMTSGPTLTMTGVTGGLTEEQTAVVCFTSGTLIKTREGNVAVEDLKIDDEVLTLDQGYQPIRWIGSRTLSKQALDANPKLRPIRIKAGALGNNMPEQDLMVSPQHRVLANSKIASRMFGVNEILVGAKHLVQLNGINVADDVTEVVYWHFLFEAHQIVFSNGARTESLYTGPEALKSISPEAREEIYSIFPGLQADPDTSTAAVRLLVPGRQARKFAERTARNEKLLFS